MSLLAVPEDWKLSFEAEPNTIVYKYYNTKNENEFVQLTINVLNKENIVKSTLNHSGAKIGPNIEYVFVGAENTPDFSPVEVFFTMCMRYKEYFHEVDEHELENLVLSCISNLFIRFPLMAYIDQSRKSSILIEGEPEGFNG